MWLLWWAVHVVLFEVGSWLAPTVISSGIAGAVALATHFSSQKAKKIESKEDIRTEAYEQAQLFYTDVIDRQDRDIAELRRQMADTVRRAAEAERAAETAKAAVRNLTEVVRERDQTIAELRTRLGFV